eukprot:TRINITY_DN31219_c0_g1_i1.p1 TRINITY_DN31219_c0_g1~~TRINITY_DN31219_c0_g1_i1.p1  ORF type:complete len:489 (+),score=127.41 TRINITY_DN31219_c0_g1_i1:61-1467(+)
MMNVRRSVLRRVSNQVRYNSSNASLSEHDPVMAELIQEELVRQASGLELIASENFTTRPVLECLGSVATNKYAEGLPGARYYGGTEVVDKIENICRDRCLEAFRLDPAEWGVNVQPYSGSVANFAALSAVLQPHDRLMGLDLPHGGHLSHGFYTPKKRVSGSSIFFESLPYRLDSKGFVDMDALEKMATLYHPKLIIAGGSAYPREWDYERYREICDKVGAYLLMDMAHISGLVATGQAKDCFKYADIVTSTTHKTLRGPRSGLVFWKKGLIDTVDDAVFPMLQGGPHMHQIAGVATQMKEVNSDHFRAYAKQVVSNSKTLAKALMETHGFQLVSGGTDNHLMLVDLRPFGLTGSKAQLILDATNITINKNTVLGDKSAMNPGGIRIGTPALTSRGFKDEDMIEVAAIISKVLNLALELQKKSGKKLADFRKEVDASPEVAQLRQEVKEYALKFSFPGLSDAFPVKSA